MAPKDVLINGLRGECPSDTVEQNVHTYIAGLRRVLEPRPGRRGPYAVLVNRSRGYAVKRGPVQADVEDLERHLTKARRLHGVDDHGGGLHALDAALVCWPGPALCRAPGPFAEVERTRLEELRLSAWKDRAQSLLDLALHQEAASALTELIAEVRLRERARDLLMLASYRCGRQGDALDAYMDIKRLLTERLNIDPGDALRAFPGMGLTRPHPAGRDAEPLSVVREEAGRP
ncbi:UNVERIFIED_ORG: DNA-binding SARP family transcriptional activator [Microbispora rosea subsp. rosea]